MKTLGQHLRELRDQHDISLRELAQRLNISATFVSDIELGKRYPSDDVLTDMSKVFQVSLSELKSYDTRPPVDELKKIIAGNPAYAFAFRQVMEKRVTPEELLKLVDKKPTRPKD